MPRPPSELVRCHLLLDPADWQRLRTYFGPTIGASAAARIAIKRLLADHEAKARFEIDKTREEEQEQQL